MNKIDTNKRKIFKVGFFFDIHPTKAYKLTNAKLFDGGEYPVVVNSAYNNGIGGFSTNLPTEKGNMITFSDTVDANTIFYQEKDFIGYSHVQGLYAIGEFKPKWNKYSLLFFCSCFRKSALTHGFDYGNKFRRDVAIDLDVLLPVDGNGNPDWEYMENYMKNIEEKCKNILEGLILTRNMSKKYLDTSGWERFHLYDEGLFDIDSGTKLDKAKMKTDNPTINFVGRANANNGVTTAIDKIENLEPYPAGYMTLSLGGEYLGSCFIQNKPFYTSQNVVVLKPKWDMSNNIKRFIGTLIFKEGRTYYKAFIDELNRHIKTDFSILLPVDKDGNPDREYMENYMKDIEEKCKNQIGSLL